MRWELEMGGGGGGGGAHPSHRPQAVDEGERGPTNLVNANANGPIGSVQEQAGLSPLQ